MKLSPQFETSRMSSPVDEGLEPLRTVTVTVGIFAYNHATFVGKAITSVLESTFRDWELIVVDDGSQDATSAAIRMAVPTDDGRIRVVSDGLNVGLANRINQVMSMANAPWLSILGGDDAYLPEGLAHLVACIEGGADVVWGDLDVMDESGRSKGYARPRDTWQGSTARKYLRPGPVGHDILRVNNFVSGTSPLVRIQAVAQVGGYTPGCRNEDLDMWLRLGRDHSFRYVGSPVARYRVVPGSTSRSERAAVLDQAAIVRRLLSRGGYSPRELARLLSMRWLLMFARTRGRAEVGVTELAAAAGLPRTAILSQLPSAGAGPLIGSAKAYLRRRFVM
jgi:glycosyltransferase involved in cell wall biosynthesis